MPSFSSPHPDWARPLPPEPPPWTERWGRKALGWTVGLAAAVAVVATAAWMVRETQVESTLAVVADHTPAPAAVAPPQAPAPALPATPEPEPPPLRMLPPEPVAAVPERAPAEDTSLTTAAPQPRVAAAAPVKRSPPAVKKPTRVTRKVAQKTTPKPVRERVLARASVPSRPAPPAPPAPPTRTAVQEAAPPPVEDPLTETLRMCRAAGYHATACLKRGCEATRYGLACRG